MWLWVLTNDKIVITVMYIVQNQGYLIGTVNVTLEVSNIKGKTCDIIFHRIRIILSLSYLSFVNFEH